MGMLYTYIKDTETKIEKEYESLDNEFKKFRMKIIDDSAYSEESDKYIKSKMKSMFKKLDIINKLLQEAHVIFTFESSISAEKDYELAYAEYFIVHAMCKFSMYFELYQSYLPYLDEALFHLNNNNN